MTEKKTRRRLGAGSSTKAQQLSRMRGIEEAAHVFDAPVSADSGDMRYLPIDEVRVDPNNPRRLGIDWEILQQSPESIEDAKTRKEIEEIHGLAKTIRLHGQRSPIEVVRDGSIKRLVFGERRYWAVRLAERSTIKAIVLRSPPDNVPLIQLIENIQHRQLPLYETILNIRMVIEREAELGQSVKDATNLIERTGLSRASAYRYWRYAALPKDVDAALEARTITTHDELAALLKHDTVVKRKEAIANYLAGGSLVASAPAVQLDKNKKPRGRGRPKTTISFGSTKSPSVAQHMFKILDSNGDYQNVDWNDVTAVTKAWKCLLGKLEKQLVGNGKEK